MTSKKATFHLTLSRNIMIKINETYDTDIIRRTRNGSIIRNGTITITSLGNMERVTRFIRLRSRGIGGGGIS